MFRRRFWIYFLVIFWGLNFGILQASENGTYGLNAVKEFYQNLERQLQEGFKWSQPFILMENEENTSIWAFGFVPNSWVVVDFREDTKYGRINIWGRTSGCYSSDRLDLYAFVITPSGKVISFDGKRYPNLANIEPVFKNFDPSSLCMKDFSFPALPFYEGDGRYFIFVGVRNPGDSFDMDGWMSISINWIPIVLGVDSEVQALIDRVSTLSDIEHILSQIERGQEYQYYLDNKHKNYLGLWVYNYFPKIVWQNKKTSCGGYAALGYELIHNGLGYKALFVGIATVPEAYSHYFLVFQRPDGGYGYQSNKRIVTGFSHWYDAVQTVIDTEILPSAPRGQIQVPFIRVGKGWKPFFSKMVRHKENYTDEDFFDIYLCNSQEIQEEAAFEGILVLTPEQARNLSFDEVLSLISQGVPCLGD